MQIAARSRPARISAPRLSPASNLATIFETEFNRPSRHDGRSRQKRSLALETTRLETAMCLDLTEGDALGDARPDRASFPAARKSRSGSSRNQARCRAFITLIESNQAPLPPVNQLHSYRRAIHINMVRSGAAPARPPSSSRRRAGRGA